MQFKDLIYAGFRNAGILVGPQESYSPDDALDGMEVLNAMLNTWKADRLTVFAILRSLFRLIPGRGSEKDPYLIGLDPSLRLPDFLIERPEVIHRASFIMENATPSVEVQLDVLNEQQYQGLSPKDMKGPVPTKLYYRPTVPNGQIMIWAVPTVAYEIALYLWQTIDEATNAADVIFLPPAYREAIEYGLALRLAARYPAEAHLSAIAIEMARVSLARLKNINAPDYLRRCEIGSLAVLDSRGRYNIFSNRKV